jgi:tRNA-binding protein
MPPRSAGMLWSPDGDGRGVDKLAGHPGNARENAAMADQGTRAHSPYDPERLPRKADVLTDVFFSLDLRVGRITEVKPFANARKPAWQMSVDFGPLIGTLATSAQVTNYSEDELVGRRVVGAVNLGTKRVAGFTSEFLVLGALEADGTVRLLDVSEAVAPGAPVA